MVPGSLERELTNDDYNLLVDIFLHWIATDIYDTLYNPIGPISYLYKATYDTISRNKTRVFPKLN